jgi:hypothetical protein
VAVEVEIPHEQDRLFHALQRHGQLAGIARFERERNAVEGAVVADEQEVGSPASGDVTFEAERQAARRLSGAEKDRRRAQRRDVGVRLHGQRRKRLRRGRERRRGQFRGEREVFPVAPRPDEKRPDLIFTKRRLDGVAGAAPERAIQRHGIRVAAAQFLDRKLDGGRTVGFVEERKPRRVAPGEIELAAEQSRSRGRELPGESAERPVVERAFHRERRPMSERLGPRGVEPRRLPHGVRVLMRGRPPNGGVAATGCGIEPDVTPGLLSRRKNANAVDA